MITREQLEKIKEFAVDLDWNLAFGGKSRGNRHLFRIVSIAKELSQGYETDISIVEAGAWLHDTNLEKTIEGDTLANKEKVSLFFRGIGVNEEDEKRIMHCIEAHDGNVPAHSLEAKIVHDADTLEKMGPLGIIRETWKRSQMGWPTEKIVEHLKTHILKREGRLNTEKARKKAGELNRILSDFLPVINKQLKEGGLFSD